MTPELDELTEKLELSFRFVDSVYLFRNEQANDHAKRTVSRFLLIQIDNLLVLVPRLKNLLLGKCASSKRTSLEKTIATLRKSYDGSYDLIRDKIGAHGQRLEAMSCFYLWGSLDYSTIEILYSDIKHLQSLVEDALNHRFPTIPDYQPLNIFGNKWLSVATGSHLRFDRFAATQPGTGYMIPLHSSQEKVQLIISILDFLNVDFAITSIVDNPKSIYTKFLFEAAWLMALIDLCSLIDNLFVDTVHDRSLLTEWTEVGINGQSVLSSMQKMRDLTLEEDIRSLRNELAAHFDKNKRILVVLDRYTSLDLGKVHDYFGALCDGFFNACRKDIRTVMFLHHNTAMTQLEKVNGKGMPFDDIDR